MQQVVERLQADYPDAVVSGGDKSEGFWIRCSSKDGNWQFDRFRLASPASASMFAQAALTEFYGA